MKPRFVADKTLGRLAKWLRVVGCDTLWGTNWSGRGLVAEARRSGRILLTRDRRLLRRKDLPPHLGIRSDHFREQLREVLEAFGIDPREGLFELCSACNTGLVDLSRDEAARRVPPYVAETQAVFRRCPACDRVYWDATHPERVSRELEALGYPPAEDGS